jgi:hypothetical protein
MKCIQCSISKSYTIAPTEPPCLFTVINEPRIPEATKLEFDVNEIFMKFWS